MSNAPTRFMCKDGAAQMIATSARQPSDHKLHRKVLLRARRRGPGRAAAAPKSENPARIARQISGMERARLMIPPAATAPAPM